MSKLEEQLLLHIKATKLPMPEREYRFAAIHVGLGSGIRGRLQEAGLKDWRFDFAWPDIKLACEIEGGGWTGGRHTRGKGFSDDLIKYDNAMRLGWTVYRCDGAMIKSGTVINIIALLIDRLSQ